MNYWNIIWNQFCDKVETSIHKNNSEMVFEKGIVKDFFSAFGWSVLTPFMIEQYPIKFATATHKADFALFVNIDDNPEIIIELKRPTKKKEDKDAKQLIDYMRQVKCNYGILLLGSKLEIYYIDYSTPEHEASLVETVKYKHDNDAAIQLMEVLNRANYTTSKMRDYCHKRLKINKSIEYWCSEDGKNEIMDIIVERSKLPEHLLETLKKSLVIDVKRTDGILPASIIGVDSGVGPKQKTSGQTSTPRIWMIPASTKYFNHRACFEELGYIYWKQYNKVKVGDTGYIYSSAPDQRITFKYEIEACDLPYSNDIEAELKYITKPEEFERIKKHNKFYRIRKIDESTSGKLTLNNMLLHGLKKAPQGAIDLSDDRFKELLNYIEKNF